MGAAPSKKKMRDKRDVSCSRGPSLSRSLNRSDDWAEDTYARRWSQAGEKRRRRVKTIARKDKIVRTRGVGVTGFEKSNKDETSVLEKRSMDESDPGHWENQS